MNKLYSLFFSVYFSSTQLNNKKTFILLTSHFFVFSMRKNKIFGLANAVFLSLQEFKKKKKIRHQQLTRLALNEKLKCNIILTF
jgi:hypothetical protein